MSGKKVMIVDDDRRLLLRLTARLKANGYQVVSAPDTISAIEVARKEVPDLVILDLHLPESDRITLLKRMREVTELMTTPVVVLTASMGPAMRNARWTPGRQPSSRSLAIITDCRSRN
jgi:DNA-binding response OmpR family regulator